MLIFTVFFGVGITFAYRGKLSFGDYKILTGEKCSIFKALRILKNVWYIEGNKNGIEQECKIGE